MEGPRIGLRARTLHKLRQFKVYSQAAKSGATKADIPSVELHEIAHDGSRHF